MTLRSYGGGGLDIVGEMSVDLRCGPYQRTAVVLVQKGAPEELLLGTDLQPSLGFRLYQEHGVGALAEPLLAPEGEKPEPKAEDSKERDTPSPVVRLLRAERLPARHGHMVQASVDPHLRMSERLFIPMMGEDWEVEEGLVEVMDDNTVKLILKNTTNVPLRLEEGARLGELQWVEEVVEGERRPEVLVGKVLVDGDDQRARREQLWHELGVAGHTLSSREVAQL